jgi:hypothetical protein
MRMSATDEMDQGFRHAARIRSTSEITEGTE